jgi:Coenzyme PQQ synthesis protein D (PqqD)
MADGTTTQSDRGTVALDERVGRGNAMVERVGDEVVIIDLATHRVSTLNNMGARIWDTLEQPTTVRACAAAVFECAGGSGVTLEKIEIDSQTFISALVERGLLVLT